MEAINKESTLQRLKSYRKHPLSAILFLLVVISAVITLTVLIALIAYILIKGIPNLSPELFEWEYTTENVSLLFALPVGICSAIYLVEYAKRGNKLVSIVRITTETLSGIPSIVYGLFGYLFFNIFLGWSYTILGGALTLAIMILPLIMRTTEEALIAVPDLYREGSFGLGAGKLRTVFRIVLPSAVPGILAGVILAVGRIVGETAALLYPAGTATTVADGLMSSGRTLAVHMYALLNEGLYMDQAYATAVVLLVVVIGINALSGLIAKKVGVKD